MPFNPLSYLFGGTALVLLVVLGVQTFRLGSAQRDAAIAHQHQAEAESIGAKVNEIFAREEAQRERARAEAAIAASAEHERLIRDRETIETRYKNVSADRAKILAENRRLIANAPKEDSSPVGRTMRNYFVRLREQQLAFRAGGSSPPAGNR